MEISAPAPAEGHVSLPVAADLVMVGPANPTRVELASAPDPLEPPFALGPLNPPLIPHLRSSGPWFWAQLGALIIVWEEAL